MFHTPNNPPKTTTTLNNQNIGTGRGKAAGLNKDDLGQSPPFNGNKGRGRGTPLSTTNNQRDPFAYQQVGVQQPGSTLVFAVDRHISDL